MPHALPALLPMPLRGMLLLLVALSIAACGSTKVVTAQKSITYRDRLYNVSVVREVRPRRELVLPDGSTQDLERLDERSLRGLFDEYGTLRIRLVVLLDDLELIYIEGPVDGAREVRRLEDRFDAALERIQRFIADRKKTQLELF